MRRRAWSFALFAGLLLAPTVPAQAEPDRIADRLPLEVMFVGKPDSARGSAFQSYLEQHFVRVESADRDTFDTTRAGEFDVVLLDWPQGEDERWPDGQGETPLGRLESWNTPTVLLGSAGLELATRWKLKGWFG